MVARAELSVAENEERPKAVSAGSGRICTIGEERAKAGVCALLKEVRGCKFEGLEGRG